MRSSTGTVAIWEHHVTVLVDSKCGAPTALELLTSRIIANFENLKPIVGQPKFILEQTPIWKKRPRLTPTNLIQMQASESNAGRNDRIAFNSLMFSLSRRSDSKPSFLLECPCYIRVCLFLIILIFNNII